MTDQKKILSLQGLRAIMFFIIFFFHSDLYLDSYWIFNNFFIGGGCLAVTVFFILSGFVSGLSNKKVIDAKQYIRFMRNKVVKFWGYHLFFLFLSIPLSYHFFLYEKKGKISFILSFFLLQSWVPDSIVWRSYNGLAWFLSTLLFCYLGIPIANKLFDKLGQLKQKHFYVIIISLFFISVILGISIEENVEYWLYAFPPIRLLDFYSGFALARFFKGSVRDSDFVNKNIKYTYKEIFVLISIILLMIAYPFVDEGFRRQAMYIPISLYFVYLFAIGEGRIAKILSQQFWVRLGNNSLYYYISHQVVFKWMFKFYERTPLFANKTIIIDFMLVIICLAITIFSKKVIDSFLIKIKKRRRKEVE